MVGHNHVQSLPTLVEHIPLEVLGGLKGFISLEH